LLIGSDKFASITAVLTLVPEASASNEQVESLVSEKMRKINYLEYTGEWMRASATLASESADFFTGQRFTANGGRIFQ